MVETVLDIVKPKHRRADNANRPKSTSDLTMERLAPLLGHDLNRFPKFFLTRAHPVNTGIQLVPYRNFRDRLPHDEIALLGCFVGG